MRPTKWEMGVRNFIRRRRLYGSTLNIFRLKRYGPQMHMVGGGGCQIQGTFVHLNTISIIGTISRILRDVKINERFLQSTYKQ